MKIAVLSTSWPRFPGDIAGAFVRGWALSLAARGHTLRIFCPAAQGAPAREEDGPLLVRRLSYPGQRSLFYGAGAPENLSRSLLPWLEIPPFLASFARKVSQESRDCDLFVGHWLLPMGALAAWIAKRKRKPFAAVAHSGDVALLRSLPSPLFSALGRLFQGGRIACVAPHLARALARWPAPLAVLPMGVDADLFDAQRDYHAARKRLGVQGFVALALGRLVPIKGLDLLIDAAAGLSGTLLIAGDGPERSALSERARRQGVRARFFGQISGKVRRDLFAAADTLALPSRILGARTEGLPVTLLEATAAGLPVIASAVGGIPDWLKDGLEGLLPPPEDRFSLRRALVLLQNNPETGRALAQRARRKAEALRWERVAAAYEEFLLDHQTL